MTKRLFSLLFAAVLTLALTACATQQTAEPPPVDTFDPTGVFFEQTVLSDSSFQIDATLKNESTADLFFSGAFSLSRSGVLRAGHVTPFSVQKGTSQTISFDFTELNLSEGTYTVSLSYSRQDEAGTLKTGEVSFLYSYSAATTAGSEESSDLTTDVSDNIPTTETTDAPTENRDVLTTPISYMTDSEEAELAEYLFRNYVPCCFGVFESTADLSSTAVWNSIVMLNSVVDKDTSPDTGKLDAVIKKVARYYPGSNFNPEEVRLYNKETKTFTLIPVILQEYVFLSSERKGDTITVYYRNVPEDDSAPSQYATTLKKSTESGYFSFVSTRRVGAVG